MPISAATFVAGRLQRRSYRSDREMVVLGAMDGDRNRLDIRRKRPVVAEVLETRTLRPSEANPGVVSATTEANPLITRRGLSLPETETFAPKRPKGLAALGLPGGRTALTAASEGL